MADGLVRRCACLPPSEWPRRLMALVIDPGVDYHWYREERGGFWGHKPGGTAARNFDNSGNLVANQRPATGMGIRSSTATSTPVVRTPTSTTRSGGGKRSDTAPDLLATLQELAQRPR